MRLENHDGERTSLCKQFDAGTKSSLNVQHVAVASKMRVTDVYTSHLHTHVAFSSTYTQVASNM